MGSDVLTRVRQHLRESEWFTRVVIVRDTRQGWNTAEAGFIEGRLHQLCRDSKGVEHMDRIDSDESLQEDEMARLERRYLPPILGRVANRRRPGGGRIVKEYVLVFRGFARKASRCHVVVSNGADGSPRVLVGELDDNPGTTVTNAVEEVARGIRRKLVKGRGGFDLYEYVPVGARA